MPALPPTLLLLFPGIARSGPEPVGMYALHEAECAALEVFLALARERHRGSTGVVLYMSGESAWSMADMGAPATPR